jgi:PAS domain S-box-containing protein
MQLVGPLGWWRRGRVAARRLALAAAVALAYLALYLSGTLGLRAAGQDAWPALAGPTVALLLVFGLRWAPLPFLAELAAAALLPAGSRPAVPELLLGATAPVLAWGGVAALLAGRARLDPALRRPRDVGWFLLLAVGVGPAAAAALHAALAVAAGRLAWPALPAAVSGWWTAGAVGVLAVAPLLMVVSAGRARPPGLGQPVWRPRASRSETAVQALAVAATPVLALLVPAAQRPPLLYLCFAPLIWVAVRRGVPGAAAGTAALGALSVVVLALGRPAGPAGPELESFLVAAAASSLYVGALVGERATSQQRQRQLSAILDAAPDCVATVDRAGRLLYLNDAGRRMLRLGEDEQVTGRSLRELLPQLAARLAAQADLGPDLWKGATTMPAGRGGQRVPLEHVAVAHPAPDGRTEAVSAITRDVSAEQRTAARLASAEEQLGEQRLHLGAVLANVPIAMVVAAVDGTCLEVQGRALERLGPARLAEGRSLFHAFRGNDQLVGDLCQAAAGSAVSSCTTLGDAVLETHFRPVLGRGGKVKHVIGLLSDVTDRVRAEAICDELLAQLDARDAQRQDLDGALRADAAQTLTAWLRHLRILEEQMASGRPVTALAPVKQTLEQVLEAGAATPEELQAPAPVQDRGAGDAPLPPDAAAAEPAEDAGDPGAVTEPLAAVPTSAGTGGPGGPETRELVLAARPELGSGRP